MNKRTIDEMIAYFNKEVSKMDISQENKMKLLGMITAIGFESKKQDIVRCNECKYLNIVNGKEVYAFCGNLPVLFFPFDTDTREFYCADGAKMDGKKKDD